MTSQAPTDPETLLDEIKENPENPPLSFGKWENSEGFFHDQSSNYGDCEWKQSLEYTDYEPADVSRRSLALDPPTREGGDWEIVVWGFDIPDDAVVETIADKEAHEFSNTLGRYDSMDAGLRALVEELQTRDE